MTDPLNLVLNNQFVHGLPFPHGPGRYRNPFSYEDLDVVWDQRDREQEKRNAERLASFKAKLYAGSRHD